MSDTTTVTSRTINGVELPAAGTYAIDESHTHVGFAVRHMAVSKVRGQFAKVDGTLVIGENPLASSVQVTIGTDSVDTRDENRDNHVRTADFLDVENHPTITFNSTRRASRGCWVVEGRGGPHDSGHHPARRPRRDHRRRGPRPLRQPSRRIQRQDPDQPG